MITFNSNAFKCPKFEFKFINPYLDTFISNLIKKTRHLSRFSLHTVFELDNFGLIRNLVVLVEDENKPRVCACKIAHANLFSMQIKSKFRLM